MEFYTIVESLRALVYRKLAFTSWLKGFLQLKAQQHVRTVIWCDYQCKLKMDENLQVLIKGLVLALWLEAFDTALS